ncbi:MAG: hypothetical protein LJE59_02125 [Chromatiaceae bacterium]|nr:hypothetical protein [Chromatiaceae bacterium]
MRRTPAFIFVCLSLSRGAVAAGPPANMSQLMQLDQASQQELSEIQRRYVFPEATQTPQEQVARERLNRQQQTDQQQLQEMQRRELLWLNHRTGIEPVPGPQPRLDAINQLHQFRLEQRYQLNRFRLQQGLPPR